MIDKPKWMMDTAGAILNGISSGLRRAGTIHWDIGETNPRIQQELASIIEAHCPEDETVEKLVEAAKLLMQLPNIVAERNELVRDFNRLVENDDPDTHNLGDRAYKLSRQIGETYEKLEAILAKAETVEGKD